MKPSQLARVDRAVYRFRADYPSLFWALSRGGSLLAAVGVVVGILAGVGVFSSGPASAALEIVEVRTNGVGEDPFVQLVVQNVGDESAVVTRAELGQVDREAMTCARPAEHQYPLDMVPDADDELFSFPESGAVASIALAPTTLGAQEATTITLSGSSVRLESGDFTLVPFLRLVRIMLYSGDQEAADSGLVVLSDTAPFLVRASAVGGAEFWVQHPSFAWLLGSEPPFVSGTDERCREILRHLLEIFQQGDWPRATSQSGNALLSDVCLAAAEAGLSATSRMICRS